MQPTHTRCLVRGEGRRTPKSARATIARGSVTPSKPTTAEAPSCCACCTPNVGYQNWHIRRMLPPQHVRRTSCFLFFSSPPWGLILATPHLQSSCLIALIFPRAIFERICARTLSGSFLIPLGNLRLFPASRGLGEVGRVDAVVLAAPAAPAAAAASRPLEATLVASGSATILMMVAVARDLGGLTANALLVLLEREAAVTALLPPLTLLLLLLLLSGLHLCCATWGSHPPAVLLLWGSLGNAMKAILLESVA